MYATIIFSESCVNENRQKMSTPFLCWSTGSEQRDSLEIHLSNGMPSLSTSYLKFANHDTQLHIGPKDDRGCHVSRKNNAFYCRWPQKLFRSDMASILFLYCIVLLFLPFPACAQIALQQPLALEPSRSLFPSFSKDDDSSYHQATMLDNFNGDDSESDWDLDESCKFTATVGRLFNQSLHDELEKRFSGATKDNNEVKIHTSNHLFDDWALYRKDTYTLEGVPLKKHSGVPYHFMITVSDQESVVKTIPCLVEVKSGEDSPTDLPESHLHWKPGLTTLGCLPTEPVVTLSVILDVNREQLNAECRVRLLQSLSRFVRTFNLVQRNSLTLQTENIDEHTAFLSGNGDLIGPPKHSPGVGVCWSIGCGADSVELTGLDVIEKSSKNGSLARMLGFPVAKWRVENRKPKGHQLKRYKRQADLHIPKSPVVRHAAASPLPDGYKFNQNSGTSGRSQGMMSRDDADSYLADERYRPPGRARVPNYRLLKSPDVHRRMATPFVPPLPKRPVPNPPSSPGHSKINHPPEKEAGMKDIRIHGSTYFEYRVPKNAFSDPEEGNTRSLSLRIINTDPQSPEQDSWLRLDPTTQVLYGVPPKKKGSSHQSSYGYLLMAEDRDGKSTTDSFAVHLVDRPKPTNHRFVMMFSKYDQSLALPVLVSTFARRLSVALDARWHALRPPGQYTVLKVEPSGERLSISWFDNSLGSKTICEKKGIRRYLSRMGGRTDFESSNQRFSPDLEFKAKFEPFFTLKAVKNILLGPCDMDVGTTILTIPTTAIGVPPVSSKGKKFIQPPIIIPPQPPTNTFKSTPIKPTPKPMISSTNTSFATTITSTTSRVIVGPKYKYPSPINTEPGFVMKIASSVGKATVIRIDDFLFIGGPAPPRPNEFFLKLNPHQGPLPSWVTVSSEMWSVVALPLFSDFANLEIANSTHKVWRHNISAVDGYGRETESVVLEIYVLPPPDSSIKSSVTHLFQMKITNYNLQNFTVLDSIRLLSVIKDLYGDQTTENIFVHPLEAGSVVYSWHNDSLPLTNECPYMAIATLGTVLFEQGQVKTSVYERLLKSDFAIRSLELKRKNSCLKKTSPSTVTSTTTTVTSTTSTTKKTVEIETTTTSGEEVVTLAAGGVSVNVIIIVVVIICLLLLVVIVVVKCRSNAAAKRKSKERRELENGNGTSPVVFSPESPFLVEDNKAIGLSTLERQARYKASAPVILEGETENGESSSPLLRKQSSTFARPANAPPVAPSNNRDDTLGGGDEFTQNTSHTADLERPPPPPYHKPDGQPSK